jgi:hypothetical protein
MNHWKKDVQNGTVLLNHIFDLLVLVAGANENHRQEFVSYMQSDADNKEFRFGGKLGSGGKFYANRYSMWVGNYSEDDNPERDLIRNNLNQILTGFLFLTFGGKHYENLLVRNLKG